MDKEISPFKLFCKKYREIFIDLTKDPILYLIVLVAFVLGGLWVGALTFAILFLFGPVVVMYRIVIDSKS